MSTKTPGKTCVTEKSAARVCHPDIQTVPNDKDPERQPDSTDSQREPSDIIQNPTNTPSRGNTCLHIQGWRQHGEVIKRSVQPTIINKYQGNCIYNCIGTHKLSLNLTTISIYKAIISKQISFHFDVA